MNKAIDPRLDPEGKYPACGLRRGDRAALQVMDTLPLADMERTRDVYQFTTADPQGVVVIVTPDSIEVRMPTVEWTWGYAGPVKSSILWKRRRLDKLNDEQIHKLILSGVQKRQREFQPCHFCRKPTPPEHAHTLDGNWVCHGCSEQHMGVVH